LGWIAQISRKKFRKITILFAKNEIALEKATRIKTAFCFITLALVINNDAPNPPHGLCCLALCCRFVAAPSIRELVRRIEQPPVFQIGRARRRVIGMHSARPARLHHGHSIRRAP
jgi:hypothetical protein